MFYHEETSQLNNIEKMTGFYMVMVVILAFQ